MIPRAVWGSAVAVVVLALPLLGVDDYYLHLLIMAGLFFLLAAGMNLLLAAGQLNLGHTAFFGIGAYTSGLLALHLELSPLWTLPIAAAFTGVVGYLLGRLTLKLRGAYFVLVTIGFAEVIRLVATNWMELTQGPMGLAGVPPFNLGTERLTLVSKRDYYYLMAVMAGGTLYLTARLLGSRIGRALAAIQSNESLAESSGISAYRHTLLALVISCVLAGAAGGFYAHYITFLSPELFGFQNTVTMAVMVVAGGQGMVLGPALGSLVFTFVPEMLRMAVFYRMLLYGVILLLVVMFMPKGLVFYLRALLHERGRRPAPPLAVGEDAGFAAAHEGSRAPGPVLEVKQITVRFGGLAAVEGLGLDLARGEILALIGPNGAGKSTAFNVITGFQIPDAGRVDFDGRDITSMAPYRIAELGLVRMFQRTSIFPEAPALDNVLTACHRLARRRLWELVLMTSGYRREEEYVRARARATLHFVGLDHKAEEAAKNLSCGEQRLLGLAIALAPDPSVLLLDEPAAGLNAVETERLMRLIEAIRGRGLSVLLVEHDMKLVMGLCDRVVVLNYGQKIAEGTPAEIQRHPEVIRAYLGSGEIFAHS
jgi:ABC-type branched-subunit amino acid transport system ATPase component/ABC-type branched-subunit amino acid transport system permease subunit